MNKRIISICFLALCLAICLSLSAGMLFAGPAQAEANESLSDMPALYTEDGALNIQFLSQLSDWLRDHFFLRQELISVDHWLDANLLKTSGDPGVILGSDGWLYYTDTLADFTGTATMSQREVFAAAQNLSLMSRYCRENGRQFVFTIAPNKNTLYGAHMPRYGVQAEQTNASRLMEQLKQMDVDAVDLFAAFSEQGQTLYFAHDSHWNTVGAALAADRINRAFGIESRYYEGDFSQTEAHTGDLYNMLYPAFTDPERNPIYGGALTYSFTTNATRPDAIVLNTESDQPGSLLAYRDSFGNLLFPFLADSYGSCRFSRSTTYDLTKEADYVLIELVERNLGNLIENLPLVPALEVAVRLPSSDSGTLQAEVSLKGDYLQLRGQFPKIDDLSPVYIVCQEGSYEAFCLGQTGFGIQLPADSVPQYAVCLADGEEIMYKIQIKQ